MRYDFCVVGGGMVGSAMALALAKRNLQVAWISGPTVTPFSPSDAPDLRMSALSRGSVDLLHSLDAWTPISAMRNNVYDTLTVWEGEGSLVSFTGKEAGLENLGYFVENRLVQLGCEHAIAKRENLYRIADSAVTDCVTSDGAMVTLENGQVVQANWLVGADGGQSLVRKQAGIVASGWQYSQQALGVVVELTANSGHETWQQFQTVGPCAFLPMHENFAALAWYDCGATLKNLCELPHAKLLDAIVDHFPERLPAIKRVVGKAQFPLTRLHANTYMKNNTLLAGDAAHLVNPLAGQGVNMGLGDVKCLADIVTQYRQDSPHCADFVYALQTGYSDKRHRENTTMMLTLDAIYNVFNIPGRPAEWLRQLGLFAAGRSGPLKITALKRAAGLLDF